MRPRHPLCAPAAALLVLALAAGGGPLAGASEEAEILRPVTYEEWQEILAAHRGEVVVVDFWATWCVPCIERFPEMVELARRFGPRGVTFFSMSLDDREDEAALARARELLADQGAPFQHFLMDETIPDAFEKLDLLGIPAVFVYGPGGELRHRLTNDDPRDQFTAEDVERAVTELLDGP